MRINALDGLTALGVPGDVPHPARHGCAAPPRAAGPTIGRTDPCARIQRTVVPRPEDWRPGLENAGYWCPHDTRALPGGLQEFREALDRLTS